MKIIVIVVLVVVIIIIYYQNKIILNLYHVMKVKERIKKKMKEHLSTGCSRPHHLHCRKKIMSRRMIMCPRPFEFLK